MSLLPVNNSYYPLPIGAYGSPSRSPPPLRNHLYRPSRSESADDKKQPASSSVVLEDTTEAECTGTASSGEPSFVKHPDLWFPDGSVSVSSPVPFGTTLTTLQIVLRAENTLFRVHKSLLARHSGFFHDLFTLPQPEGDAKSFSHSVHASGDIEGCQVLRLHDAPEDVANLLTALVDGP